MNILTKTDSYKLNHWNQYPKNTEIVYSYFESRLGAKFDATAIVGLRHIILTNLAGVRVTEDSINQARLLIAIHFGQTTIEKITPYVFNKYQTVLSTEPIFDDGGNVISGKTVINPSVRIDWNRYWKDTKQVEMFNFIGWNYILTKLGGVLPLRIKAAPEGLPIPTNNVLMTVENLDPKCFWLTNYVESVLTHVWYPSTVAALSRHVKTTVKKFLDKTAMNSGGLDFMLQDFGYRGATTNEAAEIGGAAHLVNFMGTDTVVAMEFAMNYYHAAPDGLAYSVAATEHSVMTAMGKAGEVDVVERLLQEYPTGILSVVSDSYDIYNFVENILGKTFHDAILARKGVFVVRPDSVTPKHPTPEGEMVWIAQTLADKFGYTTNDKGYMVIDPHVRILWGDGIDADGIERILVALEAAGFSAENVACFGMGGGLLQKINRDTQRFAFKSSAQRRNGTWHDIWKQPKDVSKASKKGRLKLIKVHGAHGFGYATVPEADAGVDILETVFENGKIMKTYNFDEVRKNAAV